MQYPPPQLLHRPSSLLEQDSLLHTTNITKHANRPTFFGLLIFLGSLNE